MKRRRIAGLLTAAALMLTSQPSMTANAVKDRLETGTKDGYNWELWLQENQGSAKGEQGENGTFSCEWNSSLGFLYCSGHTFEDCVDWRNTERITVDYKASEFKQDGSAAYIGLHGWTKNETAEFYIIEGYGTWRPGIGGVGILGKVTSDDGTYEVFQRPVNGVTADGIARVTIRSGASVVYAGSDTMQAEDGSVLCYLNVTVPAYAAEGTVFAVASTAQVRTAAR